MSMIMYRDGHTRTRENLENFLVHFSKNWFTEKNGRNVGDESSSGLKYIEMNRFKGNHEILTIDLFDLT